MKYAWLALLFVVNSAHGNDAQGVFAAVEKSVVTISALDERGQVEAEGSGVVIGPGKIITNCHVVRDASAIRVRTQGKDWNTFLELEDVIRDLCQLRVDGLTAPAVRVRTQEQLRTGEPVYAVGNPLGFGLAVSAGLVSAVNSTGDQSHILTSAAISPGSSGGGLFDSQARLVGIVTRSFSSAQNMSLALPVQWALEVSRRGVQPRVAEAGVAEPDWMGEAISLQTASQWQKLLEHSDIWLKNYPRLGTAYAYKGLALHNLKRLSEAKQVYLDGLKIAPRNALMLGYLSTTLHGLGDLQGAQEALQRGIVVQPTLGYLYSILAERQLNAGAAEAAQDTLKTALRLTPGYYLNWELQGHLDYLRGRFDAAADAYRAALRIEPGRAPASKRLADTLTRLEDTRAARRILESITDWQAPDASLWLNLGVFEDKKGAHADAERAYRKALDIDRSSPHAWFNLALSQSRTNRFEQAEQSLDEALKYKPDFAPAWLELGSLLARRDDKSAALKAYEKATAADPSLSAAWYRLGMQRRELRDYAGAAEALEQLTRRDASNAEAWAALGEVQLRSGRAENALKSLQEAERLDAKNLFALQGLAMYYGSRGDPTRALEYAERALVVNPASAESWNSKGYSLFLLKRHPDAASALETAVRLAPGLAAAWINLGQTYLQQQQTGKAIMALGRALQLAPTAVDAQTYMAQSYLAAGQPAKAKEYLLAILQQHAGSLPALHLLTLLHLIQGEASEAKASYAKIKSLNPALARQLRATAIARGLSLSSILDE